MRRQILLLALVALVGAGCSKASAGFPSLSPIPTPPSVTATHTPILQMPNVVGMQFADAKDALKAKGFAVAKKQKYSSTVPKDEVTAQSKKVGAILAVGTEVTLTVAQAIPGPVNGNPWGYNFGCCKKIFTPPSDFCTWFTCVTTFYNGEGFVVQCDDLQYSLTGGTHQVCAAHDGYKRTLLDPSGV